MEAGLIDSGDLGDVGPDRIRSVSVCALRPLPSRSPVVAAGTLRVWRKGPISGRRPADSGGGVAGSPLGEQVERVVCGGPHGRKSPPALSEILGCERKEPARAEVVLQARVEFVHPAHRYADEHVVRLSQREWIRLVSIRAHPGDAVRVGVQAQFGRVDLHEEGARLIVRARVFARGKGHRRRGPGRIERRLGGEGCRAPDENGDGDDRHGRRSGSPHTLQYPRGPAHLRAAARSGRRSQPESWMPQRSCQEAPDARRRRPMPLLKASAGAVMGSTATVRSCPG